MKHLLSLFIGSLLLACGNGIESTENTSIENEKRIDSNLVVEEISEVERSASFIHVYQLFTKALQEKKSDEISEFIHPKHRVKLITNFSGAMPQLMSFPRYSHFDHDEQVRLKFEEIDSLLLVPKLETLPKVTCDELTYDKQGCFAIEGNNNLNQHPWNEKGEHNELIETVKWTVTNTYNFTFYFSEIDGLYYLTFIDIRTPCSA